MNYRQARIKITLEQIAIFPFVCLGMLLGHIFPFKHKSDYFLFFASDVIGGATKVNADIVSLLAPYGATVIFSKKYGNRGFASQFKHPNVNILDLRNRIDNKAFYFLNFIYRGILGTWMKQAGAKYAFGGEALFFYKVIPYLNKSIKIIELCHLNTWLNYTQAFVKYIDSRIVSTPKLQRNMERQYKENGIPDKYLQRLKFIDNWVDVPDYTWQANPNLEVLFVGRGAPQKRVYLISKIAEKVFEQGKNIHFTFIGDVKDLLSPEVKMRATVHEYIEDKNILYKIYDKSDILILTSAYEGLPIVVMDMMVRGKVIISTAVDGIPDYIKHNFSGLLIDDINNEESIVEAGVDFILEMNNDRLKMRSLGQNAYHFSKERFRKESFDAEYLRIFGIRT